MNGFFDTRRYVTNFDSAKTGNIITDVLVIGSGVAGARAAIAAAEYGAVILATKGEFEDSATNKAQGGIAAALSEIDSPEKHFADTMQVGCQLNNPKAVEALVREGPEAIEELISWGFEADKDGAAVALGREGGHSLNRVLHSHGDQTGRELSRTLAQRVHKMEDIRVFDHCFVIDLVTIDGRCVGAVTFHQRHGHQLIWARHTILASGGCGQAWRETTNPPIATGDGVAAAFRAGAVLQDMEMMQFHPTTLYIAGAGRALISEALRGEGAFLVDRDGNRFMADVHSDAELAPRDVVSRAIQHHLATTRSNCVFLDVRHIDQIKNRFPFVAQLCADFEIDIAKQLIPVRPSAHYMIGGVKVDLDGSSSIEGLSCCGEAACNGVHGANRMASNSLLEGLVFGKRVGEQVGKRAAGPEKAINIRSIQNVTPLSERTMLDLADIGNSLRSLMWRDVGIVRTRNGLLETCGTLRFWAHFVLDKTLDSTAGWEIQNKLTVAYAVSLSALERTDSLGVHFREDSSTANNHTPYHIEIARSEAGTQPCRQLISARLSSS